MSIVTESVTVEIQQDIVYALAESATALYAACSSGLYRSSDNGQSWQEAIPALRTGQPVAMTSVATHGSYVFAGTYGTVMVSTDDGLTWQPGQMPSPPPQIVALALSPNFAEDGFIAAATLEDGVLVSKDGGLHWTAWNFGLIDHTVYTLALSPNFQVDSTIYAGTSSGLYYSTTAGKAWQELPFPVDAAPILSLAVSTAFEADGTLYAGTEDRGLWVSYDRGMTWATIKETTGAAINAIQAVNASAQVLPNLWLITDGIVTRVDLSKSSLALTPQVPGNQSATALLVRSGGVLVGFAEGEVKHIQ